MGQHCNQRGQLYELKTPAPIIDTQPIQKTQPEQPKTDAAAFRHLASSINERLSQLRYCLQDLQQIERHEVKQFPNGLIYQGTLENNQMHGTGRLIMPDGSYYQGGFSCNQIDGEGILVDSQGLYYLGHFKNNKAEGSGKYVGLDFTYEGEFKQNVQSGFGRLVKNNEVYEGTFDKGKKKKGKLTKASDETVYEGAFQGNIENGFGRLAVKDGIYEGIFQNGLLEGQAKLILANGETKTVYFRNGRKAEPARNESFEAYKSRAQLGHQKLIKTT